MALIRSTFCPEQGAVEFDAQHCLSQLQQAEPNARRQAAIALGQQPGFSRALVQQLDREHDANVVEALIGALALQADETAVEALIDCMRSEDAGLRNDAIEALKSAGTTHPQLIQQALVDSDSDVRILAIGILETLRHVDVQDWLLELLSHEPHINVCACAIDLLCEIGTSQALPVLEACRLRFAGEDYLLFAIELAMTRLNAESSE